MNVLVLTLIAEQFVSNARTERFADRNQVTTRESHRVCTRNGFGYR